MKGGTVALIVALPVVLGGAGVGAYFLLRKRSVTPNQQSLNMGAAQAVYGSKAVSQMAPVGAPSTAVAGGGGGGGGGLLGGVAGGVAGGMIDKMYPGLGGVAAGVASKATGAVTSLAKKIPGLGSIGSKLHLW